MNILHKVYFMANCIIKLLIIIAFKKKASTDNDKEKSLIAAQEFSNLDKYKVEW